MTIASVENVTFKMLVLNENQATEDELVIVTVDKGPQVYGTEYYRGLMKYEGQQVDMVSASFTDSSGKTSDQGKIRLEISLQGGNTFQSPYVTVTPDGTTLSDLHCIEISDDSPGSTALVITFLEPEKDESIAYPILYLHTLQGIIDPGLAVDRKPD